MPQDSGPPEPPSVYEVAEEVEGQDNARGGDRNVEVQNALQNIVLFAQDFMDVLDDLVVEPIVPLAIFFPRPERPAGRFRQPLRWNAPADPGYIIRPELLGRRIPGGNFIDLVRPGDRPIRPAGLLGRPIHPGGIFREPPRPGRHDIGIFRRQVPHDVFQGPDEEDLEQAHARPVVIGVEPDRPPAVGAGPAALGAEPERAAVVGVEPAALGAEPERAAAVGAEPAALGVEPERAAAVGAEPERPVAVSAEQQRPIAVGEEPIRPAVMGAEIVRPLVMGAEAVRPAAMGAEADGPSASVSEPKSKCPVPVKRARFDTLEAGSSEQSNEGGSDDKSMNIIHDSSESN